MARPTSDGLDRLRGRQGRLDPVIVLAGLVFLGIGAVYVLPLLSPAALREFADYYAELPLMALVIVAIRHGLSGVTVPE